MIYNFGMVGIFLLRIKVTVMRDTEYMFVYLTKGSYSWLYSILLFNYNYWRKDTFLCMENEYIKWRISCFCYCSMWYYEFDCIILVFVIIFFIYEVCLVRVSIYIRFFFFYSKICFAVFGERILKLVLILFGKF